MTTPDLIVVGAGPAGSSAAIFASRLGMDVMRSSGREGTNSVEAAYHMA